MALEMVVILFSSCYVGCLSLTVIILYIAGDVMSRLFAKIF
nr:MAG TPA: hypothetical protein [Caudoviricetes sp.]